MVYVFLLIFLIIGILIYRNKLLDNNFFIFPCLIFFICAQIISTNLQTDFFIIISTVVFFIIYFINKYKKQAFISFYFLTLFVLILGFFSYKDQQYSNADNYINTEVLLLVIPEELQQAYLDYFAIAGYYKEDIGLYVNGQKENLQLELDKMSLLEKYEFYNYSQDYIYERSLYYNTNMEQIIQGIENEITYYDSLSGDAKIEYQNYLTNKVEDFVE